MAFAPPSPYSHIFGIDIAKKTFDVHCHNTATARAFPNTEAGHRAFLRWLTAHPGLCSPIVLMEHTGHYSFALERFCEAQRLPFQLASGLAIRRSAGIVRGKTDPADAAMIARYGYRHRDELCPAVPKTNTELKLRQLSSLREKLVTDRAGYRVRLAEMEAALGKSHAREVAKSTATLLRTFDRQIAAMDSSIAGLIASSEEYERNRKLICSVKGTGPVIATHLLLATRNFSSFPTWRHFASWAGVAPFAYSSGISVRGRTKVSPLANRKMKSLLHQAAIIAVQHDAELRAYFARKLKEGKAKMSIYNAVRAKLLARVFAVVKRGTVLENITPTKIKLAIIKT